jgi:hypothetical protein
MWVRFLLALPKNSIVFYSPILNNLKLMEAKTYKGGCHCGKIRFEVTTNLENVITCNCSICSKAGTVLAFVSEEQFKLESGEEALSNYQFNKKVINHLFCKHCGIKAFGRGSSPDGQKMVAINVRCLDDYDKLKVTPTPFNGKDA